MRTVHAIVGLTLTSIVVSIAPAQEQVVRIATYNIKKLDVDDIGSQENRAEKLLQVIDLLDADVVALQEIDDEPAARIAFPDDGEWTIVIDNDSNSDQDIAFAIRRDTIALADFPDAPAHDAEDDDFLFPSADDNDHFPVRRDVLALRLVARETGQEFWVMNIHAKARSDGRASTDSRREGASRDILTTLNAEFDGVPLVLLGDFNDNPDDRSLNILETGDPNAPAGPESNPGPFLINLCEPLVVDDHVSHGLKTDAINHATERVDTVDPGSRQRNNDFRGTNMNTGDILFDQLLVSPEMFAHYVAGSARVFDEVVAVEGNEGNRASDHVPVYAEFVFVAAAPVEPGLDIVALLPDPDGDDRDNERVTIANSTDADADLTGWMITDLAGHEVPLTVLVPAGAELTITLPGLLLNNSGDTITLRDPDGDPVDEVSYQASDVVRGATIRFD